MSWRVEFDHRTAYIHGPKAEARRRIHACGDSSPLWSRMRNAWATSPAIANAVLDQLEGRQAVSIQDAAQEVLF